MIQGKILTYGDDLSEAFEIRSNVFVKEQGITEEEEYDDFDLEAIHVIVYEDVPHQPNGMINTGGSYKKAVATGRIVYDGMSCNIGHVAVLKEFRGKKYGDFTVRMLLNKAFMAGIKEVTLITKSSDEDFFGKIGFQCSGNRFMESGEEFSHMNIHINDIQTKCKK
jgi:predicted GNAT family N-acyltransferase